MKRYFPFLLIAGGIVAALWLMSGRAMAARQRRQEDLDQVLAR